MQPDFDRQLFEYKFQLALAKSINSMLGDERWQTFTKTIQKVQRLAMAGLTSGKLDPYDLGLLQGKYSALTLITREKPVPEEQIKLIEQRIADMEQAAAKVSETYASVTEDERLQEFNEYQEAMKGLATMEQP